MKLLSNPDNSDSAPFRSKQKIPGQTGNDGTEDVQIMAPLKYLSDFGEYWK